MKFSEYGSSQQSQRHKIVRLVLTALTVIIILSLAFASFGYLSSGSMVIKQDFWFGNLSLKTNAGIVYKLLGDTWKFPKEESIVFSNDVDKDPDAKAIFVRHNDGGTEYWGGSARFAYSQAPDPMFLVLKIFGAAKNVVKELFIPGIREICTSTASVVSTEERYTSKRSKINDWCLEQAQEGVFSCKVDYESVEDEFGKTSVVPVYNIDRTRRKNPIFGPFDITCNLFKVTEFQFLGSIDSLISVKMKYRSELQVTNEQIKEYTQRLTEVAAIGQRELTEREKDQEKLREEKIQRFEAYRKQELEVNRGDSISTVNELAATKLEVSAEINRVKGEAAEREKAMLGDKALAKRLKAYQDIMNYWTTKIKERPENAPEMAASWNADYFYDLLEKIDSRVKKNLGLDLTFNQ